MRGNLQNTIFKIVWRFQKLYNNDLSGYHRIGRNGNIDISVQLYLMSNPNICNSLYLVWHILYVKSIVMFFDLTAPFAIDVVSLFGVNQAFMICGCPYIVLSDLQC